MIMSKQTVKMVKNGFVLKEIISFIIFIII